MTKVFMHWTWVGEQHDDFSLVEVRLSKLSTKCDVEETPLHIARTELDTLMYQLAGIGLVPTYVDSTGPVTFEKTRKVTKKKTGGLTKEFWVGVSTVGIIATALAIIIVWLIK